MQGTAREPVSSTEEASEESVRTTQELCHPPPPISASSKGVLIMSLKACHWFMYLVMRYFAALAVSSKRCCKSSSAAP